MWASTHSQGDQASLRLAEHAAANGSAANGDAAHGTAANGVSGNSNGTAGGTAAFERLSVQPATTGDGRSGVTDGSGAGVVLLAATAAPAGSQPEAAAHSNGEPPCQGVPKGPLVLPAPECLRPELNGVDRDLQNTLR